MNRDPFDLKKKACNEAYEFFNKNIRKLPRRANGEFNEDFEEFSDSDIDAFRHAYVSGVFTQEYGSIVANILGSLNELTSASNTTGGGVESNNMDYWNNAIGRKYGKVTRTRRTLALKIKIALENGELITNLKDPRVYATSHLPLKINNAVIVLHQSKTGRNEIFFDLTKSTTMTSAEFVELIEQGQYSGYCVANIHGIPTPRSKPNNSDGDNLG